jgi:uracil-DNA glycosylase
MINKIKNSLTNKSWNNILTNDFNSDYFTNLENYILQEYNQYKVFPPKELIYNAFNKTCFNDVKVVIIGQDPYHGENQAHGLSFSVLEGNNHPPSLRNIFKEIENDIGISYPKSGDLTPWAEQGVLLLNASLTVREAEANSHQKIGWQKFTDSVIQELSDKREGLVFLLWGGFAKKKGARIDLLKHHVLTSGHPSPLSANRGFWFGNKHFSKTNEMLRQLGKTEINWEIK